MSDLLRIYSNVQAMRTSRALIEVNDRLGVHSYRLATGKRINEAGDDPAGYHLARSLERRRRGLSVALQNVQNADSIMNIAEGGYTSIVEILQTIKEKATQASDMAFSLPQRTALDNQVHALIEELEEIVDDTTFNDTRLIDGTFSGNFHTGEQFDDELSVSLISSDSASLGVNSIDLTNVTDAKTAIVSADNAIDLIATYVQDVGEIKVRLQQKQKALSTQITNTESVRSSVEDADFAEEQMELVKLQILQQTSVSALTQANSAPQIVLSLIQ